jgi:hypothetical protein
MFVCFAFFFEFTDDFMEFSSGSLDFFLQKNSTNYVDQKNILLKEETELEILFKNNFCSE